MFQLSTFRSTSAVSRLSALASTTAALHESHTEPRCSLGLKQAVLVTNSKTKQKVGGASARSTPEDDDHVRISHLCDITSYY